MKTLLKRIKIAFLVLFAKNEFMENVYGTIKRHGQIVFLDENEPFVIIGKTKDIKDSDYMAVPINMSQEEFDDIMNREWEDC